MIGLDDDLSSSERNWVWRWRIGGSVCEFLKIKVFPQSEKKRPRIVEVFSHRRSDLTFEAQPYS